MCPATCRLRGYRNLPAKLESQPLPGGRARMPALAAVFEVHEIRRLPKANELENKDHHHNHADDVKDVHGNEALITHRVCDGSWAYLCAEHLVGA